MTTYSLYAQAVFHRIALGVAEEKFLMSTSSLGAQAVFHHEVLGGRGELFDGLITFRGSGSISPLARPLALGIA